MKKFIILSFLLVNGLNASDCDSLHHFDSDDSDYEPLISGIYTGCMNDDIDSVKQSIRKGADINAIVTDKSFTYYYGQAPIHIACRKKIYSSINYDILDYLIKNGAKINLKNFNGNTPLNIAILDNNPELFEYLIKKGGIIGDGKNTPLHFAVQNNCLPMVQYFIEKGYDINLKDQSWENSPLHLAIELGHIEIIKYLINQNASLDIKNKYELTPLVWAVLKNRIDVINVLLTKYSELKKELDYNVLFPASKFNKPKIAAMLVDNGANIHSTNKQSLTPIEFACENDSLETFQYLLQKELEFDPNYLIVKKQFLMDLAKNNPDLVILKFICSNYGLNNVDINQLAHNACINENLNAIQFLVSNKQINIISFVRENDCSILFEIFKAGKINVLKYLIHLDPSLIAEKFKGNYILSYDYDKNTYIELLNYLYLFPNTCKIEYFGKNINDTDIASALLQISIPLQNDLLNAKIKELFPSTETSTLRLFETIKSQMLEILQSNNISRIKTLTGLNIFFSPSQMAEIIINKMQNPKMNEKVMAELLNRTAIYFDLFEFKDHEGKNIVHYIVDLREKGENLCLVIYQLCRDKIDNKGCRENNPFYINFMHNVEEIKRKKDAECIIL